MSLSSLKTGYLPARLIWFALWNLFVSYPKAMTITWICSIATANKCLLETIHTFQMRANAKEKKKEKKEKGVIHSQSMVLHWSFSPYLKTKWDVSRRHFKWQSIKSLYHATCLILRFSEPKAMWTSPSNTFRPNIPCLHHTLILNK